MGLRTLAYVAFLLLLIPFGATLESGSSARESGGGIMAALIVCLIGSLAFFLVNALLVLAALVKGGSIRLSVIGCASSLTVIAGILVFEVLI